WKIHAPFASNQTANASSGTTYDWTNTGETVDPNMHDIGLIFLSSPITLSTYPTIATSPVADGTSIVNIGRIRNGQLSTTQLYYGSVPVSAHNAQRDGFPYDYEATDIIESGDSGGPDEAPNHVIVSVNSGGGGTEVLARVDLIASWINQQISSPTGSSSSTT